MIHLVGIVFTGGIGVPLFINEELFEDQPVELIWAVSSAIQTFVSDSLGDIHGKRTSSDLKSGHIRLINYDPFVDLEDVPKSLDLYTIMALQDRYDNIELTREKLREIHNMILPLGLDKENASVGFYVPKQYLKKIENVVLRTQELEEESLNKVKKLVHSYITKLIEDGFVPLKISIADIDNGLIFSENAKFLIEDPALTDLILSNIVAENPADSKSVSIERDAPNWIETSSTMREVFTMDHIGENTDFRLLTRICIKNEEGERFRLNERLFQLSQELIEVIAKPDTE